MTDPQGPKSAPPKDVTVETRQDTILDAAFHAFATYGYRRASMEDIAQIAGLSRTALYLHFRSKDDIFRSLSDRYFALCLSDMTAALSRPGPPEDVLRAAFAAKDGKFMDVVLGTPHGRELLDAGYALSADLAQGAEAQMTDTLARWLAAEGADRALGDATAAASLAMATLKGLKTTAPDLGTYRAGQAMLARLLARALA